MNCRCRMGGSSTRGSATPSTGPTTGQASGRTSCETKLGVTDEGFWNCVSNRVSPDRGQTQPVAEAIPVGVIRTLIREAHIAEAEVRAMTKAEAVARLTDFYTTGK